MENFLFVLYLLGSGNLCALAYEVSKAPGFNHQMTSAGSYLMGMVFRLGVYCYYGSEITSEVSAPDCAAHNQLQPESGGGALLQRLAGGTHGLQAALRSGDSTLAPPRPLHGRQVWHAVSGHLLQDH
ncbi:uncharacterized protein LOC134542969 isoform X2 [Bacillus rossius redtenbacheri]|uniref:uncharacterized protein LOC134542969 isoform X2 n=1 Tax=Bacillus rossius redtenbacheri TaxID=93214 RepID=UPI002FDCDA6A